MKLSFLKLSPGFLLLWLVLIIVIGAKLYLIRTATLPDFVGLGIFGLGMLVISYLGAWAIWSFSGKDQRTGELSYLSIMTLIFLIRTVMLYSEALANR